MTASIGKRVVKSAGMLFRVSVGVPSYKTDDSDREYTEMRKLCLMVSTCDIIHWHMYHICLGWSLCVSSLTELCDFCASMKLSSTI